MRQLRSKRKRKNSPNHSELPSLEKQETQKNYWKIHFIFLNLSDIFLSTLVRGEKKFQIQNSLNKIFGIFMVFFWRREKKKERRKKFFPQISEENSNKSERFWSPRGKFLSWWIELFLRIWGYHQRTKNSERRKFFNFFE